MMEMMMEDRQERRAQEQRQERTLQEDERIVVQERQVDGRWRGRINHATMQPRKMEIVHEDRDGGVKLKIPLFCGTPDSEAYLQWERKIEHVFDCNTYNENKKIRLAVTTLNFHISKVATNVSCSSIKQKYNSYMNIIYNVNFKNI